MNEGRPRILILIDFFLLKFMDSFVIISCVICCVVCIFSSVFSQYILIPDLLGNYDKEFEKNTTQLVIGKDEASAREIVKDEMMKLGEESSGFKGGIDIKAGTGLSCPLTAPSMNDEKSKLPILIHMKDKKATGVTMCHWDEYGERMFS